MVAETSLDAYQLHGSINSSRPLSASGNRIKFSNGPEASLLGTRTLSCTRSIQIRRRTLLLQQREPGSATEPRRFNSSSNGRYVSAPRPDISAVVVPLTSEMSPLRPGSSMSTATIRFRPSGAATTARCHGHHRQQQQQPHHIETSSETRDIAAMSSHPS